MTYGIIYFELLKYPWTQCQGRTYVSDHTINWKLVAWSKQANLLKNYEKKQFSPQTVKLNSH